MTTTAESAQHLTDQQDRQYREQGYLTGIDVFSPAEVTKLNSNLMLMCRCLQDNETFLDTREWHESSRWLYDVCTDSRILDRVESILGPSFYLWGSQFFSKEPYSPTAVAWHQDAYYWPMTPHKSVTAWVAFLDSNDDNGAMRDFLRSHRSGPIKHKEAGADSLLSLTTDEGSFNAKDAVTLKLRAGQMSLHDDNIIHGSQANHIGHWRMGLTIRYSATEVRNTASTPQYPFQTYIVRGEDLYHHPNHVHPPIPTAQFARRQRVMDASQRR